MADSLFRCIKFGNGRGDFAYIDLIGEIVLQGVRQHEITVGQSLHECRGTETVSAVVAKVGFASSEESGDGGLQFVIHPKATHGVMYGRIDHHRGLVGILVRYLLVHLEKVAILLFDGVPAQALDGIGEVEVDGIACAHAITGIAAFLGGTAGHVTRDEVAESGVTAFQIVVAVFLGDVDGSQLTRTDGLGIFLFLRHPDASVVAQALAHQCEFALVVAVNGDAGGVDLHIAGVGEGGAFAVAHPCRAAVAVHGVGGEVIEVAIAAGGEHHGMSSIAFQVAGDEVADDDASGATVNHHQVHHFAALVEFYCATGNLTAQGTIGAE